MKTHKRALQTTVLVIGILLLLCLNYAVKAQLIDAYRMGILTLICINIILAASLNLINGITGQFSIGHAGFMAVGAYTAGMLSVYLKNVINIGYTLSLQNLPVFLAVIVAGGIAAGILGFFIGLPTLRLKGDYLAIATLGFGEIIRVVILNVPQTGGPMGLTGIPNLTNFYIAEILAILTIIIIANITSSTHGRALLSIREDEIAAEAMGVNTTKYKVTAFTIGAFFAGIAGALFAHYLMYISPSSFGFMKSVEYLVMVVLGGLGSITGAVFAAGVLTFLSEALRSVGEYRMVAYSLLLIILMLTRPQGLFGTKEISDLFKTRKKSDSPVKSDISSTSSNAR